MHLECRWWRLWIPRDEFQLIHYIRASHARQHWHLVCCFSTTLTKILHLGDGRKVHYSKHLMRNENRMETKRKLEKETIVSRGSSVLAHRITKSINQFKYVFSERASNWLLRVTVLTLLQSRSYSSTVELYSSFSSGQVKFQWIVRFLEGPCTCQ